MKISSEHYHKKRNVSNTYLSCTLGGKNAMWNMTINQLHYTNGKISCSTYNLAAVFLTLNLCSVLVTFILFFDLWCLVVKEKDCDALSYYVFRLCSFVAFEDLR